MVLNLFKYLYNIYTSFSGINNAGSRSIVTLATMLIAMTAHSFTVIIDAGHGGKDHGAIGSFTNEKTINLSVAGRVRDILKKELDGCKVVMTRNDDKFVTLQGRADIANESKGDIFVSIHANSVGLNTPGRTSVNGASVYTLGLEKSDVNMEIAKRENAVIMLEADYTKTYQGFDPNSTESYIMFEIDHSINMDNSIKLAGEVQRELVRTAGRKDNGVRQAPFYVLVKTAMPAILVELDFICNPTQEKFMASDSGSDKLARAIANAIIKYNKGISTTVKTNNTKPKSGQVKEPAIAERATPSQDSNPGNPSSQSNQVIYKVQFLTSGSKVIKNGDQMFKGLENVDHYKDSDGIIKYTIGASPSLTEIKKLLRQVKEIFPQAFIIKTMNGQRIR